MSRDTLSEADRAEIVRRYEAGASTGELAREFGRSREGICLVLRPRVQMRRKEETRRGRIARGRQAWAADYLAGRPLREIAAEAGITHQGAWEWIANHTTARRWCVRELLTAEEWCEAYWGEDEPSCALLAERLGIRHQQVYAALVYYGIPLRSRGEGQQAACFHGRKRLPPWPGGNGRKK